MENFIKRTLNSKIKKSILILITLFIVYDSNPIGTAIVPNSVNIKQFERINKNHLDSIHETLLINIDYYIQTYGPGSKIDASEFVRSAQKYNYDIVLALAQGRVESYYGTVGIGSRTNSIFNVGTYDDGTILYRYKHPNHSIEPYMDLMTRRYLKTTCVEDLLKSKSFVNDKGLRYASFLNYEYEVRTVYNNIIKNTIIDDLYETYTSYNYQTSKVIYNVHNNIKIINSN
jgi:hypothetical protein